MEGKYPASPSKHEPSKIQIIFTQACKLNDSLQLPEIGTKNMKRQRVKRSTHKTLMTQSTDDEQIIQERFQNSEFLTNSSLTAEISQVGGGQQL